MENVAYARGGEGGEPSTSCITLHGTFDGEAARAVMETVRQVGTGGVVLDFSKVNFSQDFALALLAQGLSRSPEVRILTRGLHGHAERLLRYLRIDPQTLAPLEESELHPPRPTARWNTDLDD